MPEERVCFICGRPNHRNSRVCADCAVAYDMERPFAPDEPATAAPSLQLKSETAPPASTGRIPLPPQLRPAEEKRAAETPRPVRLEPPTVEAPARVEEKAKVTTCTSCGEETNPAFSFCTHCGADLPGQTRAAAPAARPSAAVRAAELPQGIRDTRTAMRRIAEVHRQQEAAAQQQVHATATATGQRQQTRSEAIVIDTKREINPTVNAALSFFFPGVGQMLNGQVGKGVLLLVGSIVAVQLLKFNSFGVPMLIAGVLAAVDAYRIGERRRKGERVEPGEWDFS